MRIIFVRFHNLSPRCWHGCLPMDSWSTYCRSSTSTFLFLCTLFKKDFSKHVFFFVWLLIVLNIVVMRLVENAIWIVITVRIFVSNSSNLAELHLRVLICTFSTSLLSKTYLLRIIALHAVGASSWIACMLLSKVLASKKQHLFVKATDNRYFWLLRLSRFDLSICRLSWLLLMFCIILSHVGLTIMHRSPICVSVCCTEAIDLGPIGLNITTVIWKTHALTLSWVGRVFVLKSRWPDRIILH